MDTETRAKDTSSADTAQPTVLLTVREIAARLKCSTRMVYRLADAGRMPPPCRLGKLVRWKTEAIDAWIEQGCPNCRKR